MSKNQVKTLPFGLLPKSQKKKLEKITFSLEKPLLKHKERKDTPIEWYTQSLFPCPNPKGLVTCNLRNDSVCNLIEQHVMCETPLPFSPLQCNFGEMTTPTMSKDGNQLLQINDIDLDGIEFEGLFENYSKLKNPLGYSNKQPVHESLKRETQNLFQRKNPEFNKTKKAKIEKKKRVHSKPEPQIIDPSRKWYIESRNEEFFDLSFKIESKSRLEKRIDLVPDRLYSSIQYQIFLEFSGSFLSNPEFQFLLAKIDVLDADSGEIIENGVYGEIKCALAKKNKKIIGKLRARFKKELSSHNTSKEYKYLVSLYLPEQLENSVVSISTPSFKIFSRKPNKKRGRECRQKQVPKNKEDLFNPPTKKQKKDDIDLFKEKLDDLMNFQNSLEIEEKNKCQELLLGWVQNSFEEFL